MGKLGLARWDHGPIGKGVERRVLKKRYGRGKQGLFKQLRPSLLGSACNKEL